MKLQCEAPQGAPNEAPHGTPDGLHIGSIYSRPILDDRRGTGTQKKPGMCIYIIPAKHPNRKDLRIP